MKKIIPIVVGALLIMSLAPIVSGDTTNITGTFDPSVSMSASLDNDTFAWGSLSAGASGTKKANLSNDGDVNIDTTIQETSGAANMYHSTNASLAQDEYWLNYTLDEGSDSWGDLASASAQTLETNVNASGLAANWTNFKAEITMGPSFSADHAQQSITIQIAYTEHT